MKNADYPAMPQANEEIVSAFLEHEYEAPNGLTKREHFAGLAMQGFIASFGEHDVTEATEIAHDAVLFADALLAELERAS